MHFKHKVTYYAADFTRLSKVNKALPLLKELYLILHNKNYCYEKKFLFLLKCL